MLFSKRSLSRAAVPLAVLVGLLGSGLLVWRASDAAFTATTSNRSNSFTAGRVEISNGLGGSSLFSANNLVPGSTGIACVDVTYSGSVDSSVKFYAAYGGTSDLAQYLTFQVDQLNANAPCSSSAGAVETLWGGGSKTLGGLVAAANSYGNGLGTWTPSATTTRRYRFTYSLQDTNAAQGLGTQVDFTWEARSTGP